MKKKIIVWSLIVIFIIAALILSFLYIATDTFKSDKELFFKYLSKAEILDENFVQKYKEIIKKENQSNSSSTGTITCSTVSNRNETNIANVDQLFNIKYNSLKNKNLNQDYADFTLNSNNEDIVTARYLRDNNVYGIKIENVLKKYIAIENNNLKDFCSKLGIENSEAIPNSIAISSVDNLLRIEENQLSVIKTNYIDILLNNLTKNNFAKSKNSDSVTIKLSLTEREFTNILKQELETLKNDNNTLNFIINKANTLGYSINIESLIGYIQNQINSLNTNTEISDEQFINISVTENNNNLVKIDCVIYDKKIGVNGEILDNEKDEYLLSVDMNQSGKIAIIVKDKENNYTFDVSYGNDETKIWENIDIVSTNNETNISQDIGKIKHQLLISENKIIQDITIDVNSQEKTDQAFQININNSKEMKQDVQIEKITNQNAEILNNKTKEELEKLENAIVERIMYVYGNKIENIFNNSNILNKNQNPTNMYENTTKQESTEGIN